MQRSVLPDCYDETSEAFLVLFTDGGETSSVAHAYMRVKLKTGGYSVSNLVNGFRLGDLRSHSAPKTEVCGLLLGTKIIDLVVSVMSHIRLNKIFLFTDSPVALGALSSFTTKMKLYYLTL